MKQLPFPVRVAAGLAVTTAEHVRGLPKQLTELPVTVASQVLQASMRVQQHVTELAIKGDDVLSSLRPAEEEPSWATFDEDVEEQRPPEPNGHRAGTAFDDPWVAEERALAEEHSEGEFDSPGAPSSGPAGLTDYDELTLPQLRARLRTFSLPQLEELLAYERDHANRASFTGMLTRRIGNVRAEISDGGAEDASNR
ncbi:lipid droplet-associated protein [Prauserella cavernicola]|uniref:Lipid droplet-associated protein n=1 Tax=Prauserella cavernicola TaxID=2800127 RepID=A0A934QSX9_9PSEU|nr:lipid droplet-associated protein [Prauserella cavernicola]MBK1785656.1 lipid droplet-associated protein [Prauserella cavernicola]